MKNRTYLIIEHHPDVPSWGIVQNKLKGHELADFFRARVENTSIITLSVTLLPEVVE